MINFNFGGGGGGGGVDTVIRTHTSYEVFPGLNPGPGCIKQPKISRSFLHPFPVLQKIFFGAVMNVTYRKHTDLCNQGYSQACLTVSTRQSF